MEDDNDFAGEGGEALELGDDLDSEIDDGDEDEDEDDMQQ